MPSSENNHIFHLVEELCAIPGPTGHEDLVREWLRSRWEGRVAEWHEDAVGNVLCRVGGSGPRLLVQAHMDEIGFVVRYITPGGFLLLDTAQGPRRQSPDRRYMVGQVAQVVGRHGVVAEGVFGAATGHVLTQTQMDKAHIGYDDFFVDIGARSRAEAEERGVHVGAAVIWSWPARRIGSRIAGKAMDDRVLLAVMDLLLDQLDHQALRYELWFGATVQEENGLHGARALAHNHRFDAMVALDVGLVGDVPTVEEKEYDAHLGGGPTLVHKDASVNYDKRLLWRLADAARAADVRYQHGVYANYGSDAVAFIDHGTPAVLIGVPCRYTHSAFEMVEESDIAATVRLLRAFVSM
jgi:tetrahedral aminopeptidase